MNAGIEIQESRTGGRGLPATPLLSCYFPLGDARVSTELLDIYAGEGVDVIEIGMASPDPFLDGPDVRQSMLRADRNRWRADLDAVLERLARFRNPPRALLMTYADPAHPGLGDAGLWRGLDSLLVVARQGDPLAARLERAATDAGVALSPFLSLPLDEMAMQRARDAGFYIMLQAHAGATGPRETLDPESAGRIARLRAAGAGKPILLGFGISGGGQARQAMELGADGVIVGSKVLRAALAGGDALRELLRDLRSGLDA
ncbi:tryptophan synthase subunit alpha [Martelella soudanensis]|uniref:tryptophan synthase subunit alpha n=1 Tax=unclassified Martelella TaxID=2629616 RepID=UPI0015DEA3E4|nr:MULTISPECIES: tryptophan synthase subunit alpha [unclassified Martelella]